MFPRVYFSRAGGDNRFVHDLISFDRQILPADQAWIRAFSSAGLYGKGVFTTIAVFGATPFLWEKHWRRLIADCRRLCIDLTDHTEQKTRAAFDELIDSNGVKNGRARITFFDESSSDKWPNNTGGRTRMLIMTAERRTPPPEFRITVSPYRVNSASPLAGVKSCNYLEKLLSLAEARGRGFDESVHLNERGKIATASMANLFWLKDDVLFTPALKTGCLAGTTREVILENLDCVEIETEIDHICDADEIFLTSAGLGITQVSAFDGRTLERRSHPIAALLPPD